MFSGIQTKIILALGVAILIIGGLSGLYFWYSQDKIDILQKNNAKLTTAVELQEATINTIIKTVKNQNQQLLNLQNGISAAETRRRDLEMMIQQLDIQAMARKDRNGLELEINKQTSNMFNELTRLTSPNTIIVPTETPTVATPPIPRAPTSSSNNQPPPRPPAGKIK